ncbi:MACPF domain-containing protein NSL1-like [Syzygium oleosum]|uniref:MACPF domain-containing protein NSL1-like n=1 Tax=Syzygium oleosum TaxID=219896 RepID=UPI0011D1C9D7|nr:MACPF domain-containing protein NSL1-like [Syzygium oleosum]
MDPQSAAEKAVSVIGFGYDLVSDLRLNSCKSGRSGSRLIELEAREARDLVVPGGVVVNDVPTCIRCDKGERIRFCSDVLSFNQMSEHFNQELSLSGKIPSGIFNSMFDFKSCWQKDATAVKSLAVDGWFMTLYSIELERSQLTLSEQVKQEVPNSWDPLAIAEFIEKYGTHIVVGVKMGGKDVVHVQQLQNSHLQPTDVRNYLKQLADQRFSEDTNGTLLSDPAQLSPKLKGENLMPGNFHGVYVRSASVTPSKNNDIVSICVRKGGNDWGQSHNRWLSTVSQSPDVISMSFVPITSLLSGVQGIGFLGHAVNLYLRYKPLIEELHQFLQFQLPRQWAPVYADLPLGPTQTIYAFPSLRFTFMGPKLYVNTCQVDTGNRPVTGIRLYLEEKKSDHLAIHLQHLMSIPDTLEISDDHTYEPIHGPDERAFFEPVKCSIFSHVCTAAVQYNGSQINDSASIVTKASFEVKVSGMKKVLFLRLGFSVVASATIRRSEWDGPSSLSRKSGLFSSFISTSFSMGLNPIPPERPVKVDLNSAVYPGGPPLPLKMPRIANFVNTKEMVRGPEDPPGYWVVTGAKLCIEGGRIAVKVKYSLLTIMSEESMMLMSLN